MSDLKKEIDGVKEEMDELSRRLCAATRGGEVASDGVRGGDVDETLHDLHSKMDAFDLAGKEHYSQVPFISYY